ncbi:M23 family metallopeptidase [Clostridiaceae bacterium 35-E11]
MDWKKWLFSKKDEKENHSAKRDNVLHKLLDKEGFYIILFLCVCIVAVTAVWVTKTNIDRLAVEDLEKPFLPEDTGIMDDGMNMDEYEIEEPLVVVEDIEESEASASTNMSKQNTIKNQEKQEEKITKNVGQSKPKEEEKSTAVQAAAQPQQQSTRKTMIKPIKGDIGMNYAADTLTYSKTLEQYTTHYGVDIIASENTAVVAALAGEVVEVTVDSRLGIIITLDHGDELMTRYANLSTRHLVKVGDWVEKGQTISGVGKTALFEIAEEPHLHFEVLKEGMHVDPNQYLP